MTVAVLGAGILGTLTALNLASDGHAVDLIDARAEIWGGASSAGEGKVHLGYVYGRASDDTLRLLLDAAARFSDDVECAVGVPLSWRDLVSSDFRYLVADDSGLDTDAFEAHAAHVRDLAADVGDVAVRYLDGTPTELVVQRLHETDRGVLYSTPERSIDVARLRAVVADALAAHGNVRLRRGTRVVDVSSDGGRWWLDVDASEGGTIRLGPYSAVVNCTWESAAALDHLAGHPQVDTPNLRLRAFLGGRSHGDPLAVTVVHGPFGDFVRFSSGRTYASWYPTGILGFVESRRPPDGWQQLQQRDLGPDLAASMIAGLAPYVPAVRGLRDVVVQARVVVARGASDIDDEDSELHERADARVRAHGGWVSVRSPKLTTAPRMAREAARAAVEQ